MGPPPRRRLQRTIEDTITPPAALPETQLIARVVKAEGKNLYTVELPAGKTILVELEAKFRSTVWLKRGSFVIVDTATLADRDNKVDGQIVNVVRGEKRWRKQPYWPEEFVKRSANPEEDDEDESLVGKMPPSEDEDEGEGEDENGN